MDNNYVELPEREEIAATNDLATLMYWHEEAADVFDSVKAQIHAYVIAGSIMDGDEEWVVRARTKAGYAGATLRRIERRIVSLGAPLPLNVDRVEREQIGTLKHRVRVLEYLLRKYGISEEQEG
jgi:hypothetical protein